MKRIILKFISRNLTALLIIFLIAAAAVLSGGMISSIKKGFVKGDYESVAVSAERFILREYDGRIGVFLPGDDTPSEIIPVYVIYLPEADRKALAQGIAVSGRSKLRAMIDDFQS